MTRSVKELSNQWLVTATALALAAALSACGGETASPADRALERAHEAADALTAELAGVLGEELQRGGPASAIEVCSEVAQEMAAAHSTRGLDVRRVSLKARNPADQPDAFERTWLKRWEEDLRSGGEVSEHVEIVDGKTLRYLRPVFIASVCLQCHGDPSTLVPEVRRLIDDSYPQDSALGYAVGDLRGAVSVRVDVASE